eukprot:gene11500-11643_t
MTVTVLDKASKPSTAICPGQRVLIKVNMGYSMAGGGGNTSPPLPANRHMFMTTTIGRFGSHGKKAQWLAALGFEGTQFKDAKWCAMHGALVIGGW